jgi:transcriptional regulatory protein GAL4
VHELLSLASLIDEWEKSVPNYFQLNNPDLYQHESFILARYRLSWRAWNLRIILFRPLVLRWATKRWTANGNNEGNIEDLEEEKCRLLCLQSARDTITSISEYIASNVPSRLGSWYMLLAPFLFYLSSCFTLYSAVNADV